MSNITPLHELTKKDRDALYLASKYINNTGLFNLGASISFISGSNNYKRSCINRQLTYTIHAEVDVINKYQKITNKSVYGKTLYICRIATYNKKQQYANAKPCDNCMRYIINSGIKRIKYTDNRDNIEYLCTIKIN